MREKLAKLDCQRCYFRSGVKYRPCGLGYKLGKCLGYYGYTDQILSLLKEEIKRSLLTDTEIGDKLDLEKEYTYPCSDGSLLHTVDCRPAIQAQVNNTLKVLEEK